MRLGQGVGGAFLFANSSAILTDAFPENERGLALGINGVAAIGGSFIGLILGGVLAPIEWHLVFLVSVPIGVVRHRLVLPQAARQRRPHGRAGSTGPATSLFAVGLIGVLTGIVYGLQPLRRPHHGLDQAVRAASACSAALAVLVAVRGRRAAGRPTRCSGSTSSAAGALHDGQHRGAARRAGPRRPAVHADHLAAGHLAAAARLQLRARRRCGPASTWCR